MKATSVHQVISYPGTRAVRFIFTMRNGSTDTVTIDLVQQPQFNGRTYIDLETAAIAAMIASGRDGQVAGFTHELVSA